MEKTFYLISLHMFLVGSILYGVYLFNPKDKVLAIAHWITLAGLAVHAIPLLHIHVSRTAGIDDAAGFYALLAWSLIALYHAMRFRLKISALGIVAAPLATLFTALALLAEGNAGGAQPADMTNAPQPWVSVHVVFTTWGEALFGIAAAAGALYIYQDWRIRRKKVHGEAYLPDLATLDRLGRTLLIYGFVLLTLGLAIGTGVAMEIGRMEILSEPISMAFKVTWGIYLLLLGIRMAGFIGARQAAILATACFILSLLALMSVNLFAPAGVMAIHKG